MTSSRDRGTHEYNAPLVPPIFSAATSDTAMRAPTTSSPLIEPARRSASTAALPTYSESWLVIREDSKRTVCPRL